MAEPLRSKGSAPATTAPYYVFDSEDGGGYVIVSGDDRTAPILGYADSGNFDSDRIPMQLKRLLDSYQIQILSLQNNGMSVTAVDDDTRAPISPLIETQWAQGTASEEGSVYNRMCPLLNNNYTLTGCVATAMAQVMYYHEWPEDETAAIPAYTTYYGTSLDELPATTFSWARMRHTYDKPIEEYTEKQISAVSTLMRYAGQSVQMNYNLGASSATSGAIPAALANYFGYDNSAQVLSRQSMNSDEWYSTLYSELQAGRPVIYGGVSTEGGHAFICDGYDGNGLYHFNFGWGGYCDGYYLTEICEGFTIDQDMVIGIQPATGATTPKPQRLVISDDFIFDNAYFYTFAINHGEEADFDCVWLYTTPDAPSALRQVGSPQTYTIPQGRGFGIMALHAIIENMGLAAGVYRMYPAYRQTGTTEWQVGGTWVDVTIAPGGTLVQCAKHIPQGLTLTTLQSTAEADIAGNRMSVTATLHSTEDSYNGKMYLLLKKEGSTEFTDTIPAGAYVSANDSSTLHFQFYPRESGSFDAIVSTTTDAADSIGSGNLHIYARPVEAPDLTLTSFRVMTYSPLTIEAEVTNNSHEIYSSSLALTPRARTESNEKYYTDYRDAVIQPGATRTFLFEVNVIQHGVVNYTVTLHHLNNHSWEEFGDCEPLRFTTGLEGDVNHDGKVTIADANKVVNIFLGE